MRTTNDKRGQLVQDLISEIHDRLENDNDIEWQQRIGSILHNSYSDIRIHLAVLVEPYLQYILEGKKTIESRFSANKIAPYGCVDRGDIILLKLTGGPIVGICEVSDVWFYSLEPNSWENIKEKYAKALCIMDSQFWKKKQNASYATLMRIDNVKKINSISFKKRDRRGWITFEKIEK